MIGLRVCHINGESSWELHILHIYIWWFKKIIIVFQRKVVQWMTRQRSQLLNKAKTRTAKSSTWMTTFPNLCLPRFRLFPKAHLNQWSSYLGIISMCRWARKLQVRIFTCASLASCQYVCTDDSFHVSMYFATTALSNKVTVVPAVKNGWPGWRKHIWVASLCVFMVVFSTVTTDAEERTWVKEICKHISIIVTSLDLPVPVVEEVLRRHHRQSMRFNHLFRVTLQPRHLIDKVFLFTTLLRDRISSLFHFSRARQAAGLPRILTLTTGLIENPIPRPIHVIILRLDGDHHSDPFDVNYYSSFHFWLSAVLWWRFVIDCFLNINSNSVLNVLNYWIKSNKWVNVIVNDPTLMDKWWLSNTDSANVSMCNL